MAYNWNWGVFLQDTGIGNQETYLDWLVTGLKWTLALGVSAFIIALAVGSVMGVFRTTPNKILSRIGTCYVEFFRNIPLLVQLFIWYFVLPEVLPFGLGEAFKQLNPLLQQFLAAMVCLGLFTAARVAEQVRAGIQSLPPGQQAAALALGFTLPQSYRHVMLPMAFRLVVPPMTSEFMNVFKNSAVATTIGLIELSRQAQQLVDYTAQAYESFIAVTLIYIVINASTMVFMRWVETKTRVPGFIGSSK